MHSSLLDPALAVLETAPARAATLLHGLWAMPTVRAQLEQAGMTSADVAEGRSLLVACLAQAEPYGALHDTDDARRRRAALVALNDWVEPSFVRYGAALKRRAPNVHAYLFRDLPHSCDAEDCARCVAAFLERVEALEKGTDVVRLATKAEDAAAIEMLAARGLTHEVRRRLAELAEIASRAHDPREHLSASDGEAARLDALRALAAWVDEWTETAGALVKRREDLVRLGMA